MPVFYDLGVAGTWLDALLNSPCLNVSDFPSAAGAMPFVSQRCAAPAVDPVHGALNG
jgi:hypothetical protein